MKTKSSLFLTVMCCAMALLNVAWLVCAVAQDNMMDIVNASMLTILWVGFAIISWNAYGYYNKRRTH